MDYHGDEELISIVMTVYNEPYYMIEESIDSILKQTYKNIEVILIVDNPDNIEIINKIKEIYAENVSIYVNDRNIGLAASLNKGISYANGAIIARMDSDDIADNSRLLEEYNFMKENQLDFITSDISMINENGENITSNYYLPLSINEFAKRIRYGNCLAHPTFMFRKRIVEECGGYKAELCAAQDYEFAYRLYCNNYKMGFLNKKLLKYRIRSNSISNQRRIQQLFVTYYTQLVYRKHHTYSEEFVKESLVNQNTKTFKQFQCQLDRYFQLIDCARSRKLFQIRMCLTDKYVRWYLVNSKLSNIVVRKYHKTDAK